MTEDQLEFIADSIFKRMLAKQEEWDKKFYAEADKDHLISEIVRLNLVKMDFVNNENYEAASKIQKEINKIREILNNNKLE